ncbi:hypothetical protein WN943_007146 [Citrus x changshan-huyou]
MNDDQQGINKNYKVPELDVPSSYDIPSTAQAGIQSGKDGSNSIYWDDKSMYELTAEDVIGKRFASLEEATDFYKKYSKIMGFSVRIYDGRRDTNGAPIMKHWVCSREGERDKKYIEHTNRIREPRAITRVNCRAAFRVNLDKESKTWVARSFVPKHSHELAADFETQFLRSHRMVKDSDNALANSMQTVGIKTSQIMDFFVNQAGGYDNLGFGLKDLYNNLDNERRSMILETDSEAALAYLNAKADMDPDFFCKWIIFAQLKSEIKELRMCDNGDTDRPCSAEKKARIVKDPLVVKTKGAPSTKFNKGVNTRKCGYCKQDGHTARKCPSKNGHVTSVDNFAGPLNSFTKFIWLKVLTY